MSELDDLRVHRVSSFSPHLRDFKTEDLFFFQLPWGVSEVSFTRQNFYFMNLVKRHD